MLWVIAAEERLLCPFDADSEEMIELEVEATLRVIYILCGFALCK